jgi:DNA-binding phage protein
MLYDALEDPGSATPAEVRAAYEAELRTVVDALGVERVAADAGVDEETLVRLLDGDGVPELTLTDAAAVLALRSDSPDADAIVAEVRDHLLMGMTTGVLDVDAIASNVDLDLSGQEVQQAIEGRVPMTLERLARIQRFVESRQ